MIDEALEELLASNDSEAARDVAAALLKRARKGDIRASQYELVELKNSAIDPADDKTAPSRPALSPRHFPKVPMCAAGDLL